MTTTATFSTGATDSYKGDRAVKAAWAIISRTTGEIIASGHSLDRVKAAKTAATKLPNISGRWAGMEYGDEFYYISSSDWRDTAKIKRAKREHDAKRRVLIEAAIKIEIVDL